MERDPDQVDLSLSTICEGRLEEEFQRIYPDLVASLGSNDTASLTITVQLKRAKDTNTMLTTTYKIRPAYPPIARSAVCVIGKGNRLQTDTRRQLSIVDKLTEREGS